MPGAGSEALAYFSHCNNTPGPFGLLGGAYYIMFHTFIQVFSILLLYRLFTHHSIYLLVTVWPVSILFRF